MNKFGRLLLPHINHKSEPFDVILPHSRCPIQREASLIPNYKNYGQ